MVAVKRWLSRFAVAAMLGFGALSLMGVAAHVEPGVFDDRIVFGQSAAFDGPAGALGLAMREGILASFNEANATGGVNGHRLELVSYDVSRRPHNTRSSAAPFADIPAELGVLQLPYRRHL
jgi:branched-chain amino acid transport system substrate-binding protein